MKNKYKLYLRKYSTHYFILQNIGINKTVLDAGCNDGYLGKLSDKTNKFYGIDYSGDSIEKARKVYEDAAFYDLNQLKDLPWDIKYDVIIFGDVLEHLIDPVSVLKFFTEKYLKHDDRVIISFPNIAGWRMRLGLLLGNFDYTETGVLDRTHLHFYTFKTARELVHSSNLRIEKEFGTSTFFGRILILLPFLKTFFGNNIVLICKK